MSDVKKRCAACRKEKPVSEMKVCMHCQMHYYVCDAKCMHDFYNPPKAEKPDHDAAIAALQSRLDAAKAERDQLRAELEAIRGQEPFWYAVISERAPVIDKAIRREDVAMEYAEKASATYYGVEVVPLYRLPPQQPDAVSVPRDQSDVPLYAAIERACGELPDGWSIEVGAERGGAWVTLHNVEMEEVEFPTDNERLDYTVNDAVEFALLSTKNAEEV